MTSLPTGRSEKGQGGVLLWGAQGVDTAYSLFDKSREAT